MLLTGCAKPEIKPVTSDVKINISSSVKTVETTSETTQKPLEFNPYVYSAKLAERIPQDHWESFYNLCDALREGKNTFKCSSQEAYKWCTDIGVLCNLFPTAGLKIEGKSDDGSPAFENGTGKIHYNIPVEDYLKRQRDFEKTILDILNAADIENDDTDYEKALKLYVYMAKNYVYSDYPDTVEENYVYRVFETRKGICVNFASAYAYLLLQVNIDALNIGCSENKMDHAWTYANIGGKWYHIDVTWALHEVINNGTTNYTEATWMDYFMMSDKERTSDGCSVADLTAPLLPEYWVNRTNLSFAAVDSSYNLRGYMAFVSLDENNKILTYEDMEGKRHEFRYDR